MALWLGAPQHKSPYYTFGGHRYCGSGDIIVLIQQL